MLCTSSGTPQADELRDSIDSGGSSREHLPSGRDLARRYGVAPMTVSHALDVLRGEGLVKAYQGRQVFVTGHRAAGGRSRASGRQDLTINSLRQDLDQLAASGTVERISRTAPATEADPRDLMASYLASIQTTYVQEPARPIREHPSQPLFAPSTPLPPRITSPAPSRHPAAELADPTPPVARRDGRPINTTPSRVADRLPATRNASAAGERPRSAGPRADRRALKELTGHEPAQLGFIDQRAND